MFMFVFWIPALIILYLVLRDYLGFNKDNESGEEIKSALDILNERYANGEVDSEEYENRKRKLKE